MSTLKIQSEVIDQILHLSFDGPLDEDADYRSIDISKIKGMIFNFEKISMINSTGIQQWVAFFKEVPASLEIRFEKCAVKLVHQINLFPWFLTGKKVNILSFYAPYFCENCDQDFELLVTPGECLATGSPKAPARDCPKCGAKSIDFDSIEKKYFLFLTRNE